MGLINYHIILLRYTNCLDIDKSRLSSPRTNPRYINGVEQFLDFAYAHNKGRIVISCSFLKCKFNKSHNRNTVLDYCCKNYFHPITNFVIYMWMWGGGTNFIYTQYFKWYSFQYYNTTKESRLFESRSGNAWSGQWCIRGD